MTTLAIDQAALQKILHDLRGPLVNLKGFHSELDESVGRMLYVIGGNGGQPLCNVSGELKNIMDDDLVPIMHYLSISIDQLHERLDLFELESTNILE